MTAITSRPAQRGRADDQLLRFALRADATLCAGVGLFGALAADPDNPKATLWNPATASFEQAAEFAGVRAGTVAIIGGPDVFGMFMDRYDTFWLSLAAKVKLPGGEGCFPGVPGRTPEQILASHGLKAGERQILDPAEQVSVTPWQRT